MMMMMMLMMIMDQFLSILQHSVFFFCGFTCRLFTALPPHVVLLFSSNQHPRSLYK